MVRKIWARLQERTFVKNYQVYSVLLLNLSEVRPAQTIISWAQFKFVTLFIRNEEATWVKINVFQKELIFLATSCFS